MHYYRIQNFGVRMYDYYIKYFTCDVHSVERDLSRLSREKNVRVDVINQFQNIHRVTRCTPTTYTHTHTRAPARAYPLREYNNKK